MQAAEKIRRALVEKAGGAVADVRHFAAGNSSVLYLIDMKDGSRLVAKIASRAGARLDLEAWMLRYLREKSDLPVPDVVREDKNMILMTYLPHAGVIDAAAEEHAAELLAGLHGVSAEMYGLERDTLIGPLDQPNGSMKDWLTFFRDRRLMPMARAALEENRIDGKLMRQIEKLAGRLDRFIDRPSAPSLLHGDIWGGNVLALPGRVSGFIDPAIYYGDPEMELAFSTLFGTFGETFFRRYHEIRPLRDGFFEVRKDLYNLYPLLVHVRLFGMPYVEAVRQTVLRLAG